jgi:hypothetical protein
MLSRSSVTFVNCIFELVALHSYTPRGISKKLASGLWLPILSFSECEVFTRVV